jgi:hypothetical protein
LGGYNRGAGIDREMRQPGMQMAGEDKLYDAFLRQQAGVFRDQVTLNGMKISNNHKFHQEEK